MNWIFKEENIISDNRIEFTQRKNFRGEKNERIITLKNIGGEWYFHKLYKIENIDKKQIDEKNVITLKLELLENFETEKPLDNFLYSLVRISKFNNPIKHFNRFYNRLEDIELSAIVKDEIYYERTYLGIVLNSMHVDHKKSFLNYLAQNAPQYLTNKFDVEKTFNYLIEYLETHVLFPAEILTEINHNLEELVTQDDLEVISFSDEQSNGQNLIFAQAKIAEESIARFRQLIASFYEGNFKSKTGFKTHFKNSRIPMTI